MATGELRCHECDSLLTEDEDSLVCEYCGNSYSKADVLAWEYAHQGAKTNGTGALLPMEDAQHTQRAEGRSLLDLPPLPDLHTAYGPDPTPETDGVMRAHYKCPRTQLTVQVDPVDYDIVSNRIVKIKFCPLCRGEHHLQAWSGR